METAHIKDSCYTDKHFGKGISDVIDWSLNSKDFVGDLNAEVDLDETSEIPVCEEKKSVEVHKAVEEERPSNEEQIGEVLTKENGSVKEELFHDDESVETGSELLDVDMGNTIDDNKGMDKDVDVDFVAGEKEDKPDDAKLEIEIERGDEPGICDDEVQEQKGMVLNEPETEKVENASGIKNGTASIESETKEENNRDRNPEEKVLQIVEEDFSEGLTGNETRVEGDSNTRTETETHEGCVKETDNKLSEQKNTEKESATDQETHVKSEDQDDIRVVEEKRNETHEEGDEIDKEKVRSFIEQVINDLQEIVIETEECDKTFESSGVELSNSFVSDEKENNGNTDLNMGDHSETNNEESVCDKAKLSESPENCTNETEEKLENANDKNQVKNAEQDIVLSKSSPSEFEVPNEVSIESDKIQPQQGSANQPTDDVEAATKPKKATSAKDQNAKNDKEVMIEQELNDTRRALHASQTSLKDERAKHLREVMRLKLALYRTQTELKNQCIKSEKQMSEVMSHLVLLEGRLRQEQKKVKQEIRKKDATLETQRNELLKLKEQNAQLYNAIKEICASGGMNGYMRENKRKVGSISEGFDAKAGRGKLGTMKDKFMAKNKSSMELNTVNFDKYLIQNQRLYSSHEDLQRALEDERRRSIPNGDTNGNQRLSLSPKEYTRPVSDGIEYKNGKHRKNVKYHHGNFFSETGSPPSEINKSVSESSHLSESTNSSSGVYSQSEHELSTHDVSALNGHSYYNEQNDDEDDDGIFSFSSTAINAVINEEEDMGQVTSHPSHLTSMGSMPVLANLKDEHRIISGKNRPHSLSSVDIAAFQQHADVTHKNGTKGVPLAFLPAELNTPPPSPSSHTKHELTPFSTFKNMFRRSKNKGHKKRSVSLSQNTNTEYCEAMKKHFQKYDMQ